MENKEGQAALKKLMESNPHWQVEAWISRNRAHSREIHINDQDEAVVREVTLYEEPLFKSQDNQKQSSRAFFSDGSYPNLSSTPLSDYPHLDIYIQGEKVCRKNKTETAELGLFWEASLLDEFAAQAREAAAPKRDPTPPIREQTMQHRGSRKPSADSGPDIEIISTHSGTPSRTDKYAKEEESQDSSDDEEVKQAKKLLLLARSNKRKRQEENTNKSRKIEIKSSPHTSGNNQVKFKPEELQSGEKRKLQPTGTVKKVKGLDLTPEQDCLDYEFEEDKKES